MESGIQLEPASPKTKGGKPQRLVVIRRRQAIKEEQKTHLLQLLWNQLELV